MGGRHQKIEAFERAITHEAPPRFVDRHIGLPRAAQQLFEGELVVIIALGHLSFAIVNFQLSLSFSLS